MSRPLAPISLDLDNAWSYQMVHADPHWTALDSYMPTLIPRVLDFLDDRSVKVTFFVVGRDVTLAGHPELYGELVRRGHRIGNHSHNHEPWLHRYTVRQLDDELDRSEEAIVDATGVMPKGFRGPGFSHTPDLLTRLVARGYRYDATVFPNILNPLSRAYYFKSTNLTPEQREERSRLFGTVADALQPNKSFQWDLDGSGSLAEVPVTTFPGLRTPIHLSYLIYAASKTRGLADLYYRSALGLCRLGDNPPSMLLHPLDFLGYEDAPRLGFFPGMTLPVERKLELAHHFLDVLERWFRPIPIEDYLESQAGSRPRHRAFSASSG
ncbi:MAG: polysaccharide deacetylase family protein [Actinobacteria bacterium]|nr:polysaccharide deacetylase family protein [Actinomycetota bacterium]MCI0545088.1 polysaccharide deacetylase family protein [Actinomycetota bacterium]MCI0677547.1 polysaccharide deacetylase family protein [Actinomycetota bacterium]